MTREQGTPSFSYPQHFEKISYYLQLIDFSSQFIQDGTGPRPYNLAAGESPQERLEIMHTITERRARFSHIRDRWAQKLATMRLARAEEIIAEIQQGHEVGIVSSTLYAAAQQEHTAVLQELGQYALQNSAVGVQPALIPTSREPGSEGSSGHTPSEEGQQPGLKKLYGIQFVQDERVPVLLFPTGKPITKNLARAVNLLLEKGEQGTTVAEIEKLLSPQTPPDQLQASLIRARATLHNLRRSLPDSHGFEICHRPSEEGRTLIYFIQKKQAVEQSSHDGSSPTTDLLPSANDTSHAADPAAESITVFTAPPEGHGANGQRPVEVPSGGKKE